MTTKNLMLIMVSIKHFPTLFFQFLKIMIDRYRGKPRRLFHLFYSKYLQTKDIEQYSRIISIIKIVNYVTDNKGKERNENIMTCISRNNQ